MDASKETSGRQSVSTPPLTLEERRKVYDSAIRERDKAQPLQDPSGGTVQEGD